MSRAQRAEPMAETLAKLLLTMYPSLSIQNSGNLAHFGRAERGSHPIVLGSPKRYAYFKEQDKLEKATRTYVETAYSGDKTELLTDVWHFAQSSVFEGISPENITSPWRHLELREAIIGSSSQPSPLMAKTYRAAQERAPFQEAQTIVPLENLMALRTLASMAQPRECLAIGSLTGLSSSAVLEALPTDASITCLELNPMFLTFAENTLADRHVETMGGKTADSIRALEEAGRDFDLIVADSLVKDFEDSIRLLRPGGIAVILNYPFMDTPFPSNDAAMYHALVPLGQSYLMLGVKMEGVAREHPFTDSQKVERKIWQLDSEAAAIDRYLSEIDHPHSINEEILLDRTPSAIGVLADYLKKEKEADLHLESNEEELQAVDWSNRIGEWSKESLPDLSERLGEWSYYLASYRILQGEGGTYIFQESAGVEGTLRPHESGQWWEGDVKVGILRVRPGNDDSLESQFKENDSPFWGATITAFRGEAVGIGDRVKSLTGAEKWRPRALQVGDLGTIISADEDGSLMVQFDGVRGPLYRGQIEVVEKA